MVEGCQPLRHWQRLGPQWVRAVWSLTQVTQVTRRQVTQTFWSRHFTRVNVKWTRRHLTQGTAAKVTPGPVRNLVSIPIYPQDIGRLVAVDKWATLAFFARFSVVGSLAHSRKWFTLFWLIKTKLINLGMDISHYFPHISFLGRSRVESTLAFERARFFRSTREIGRARAGEKIWNERVLVTLALSSGHF